MNFEKSFNINPIMIRQLPAEEAGAFCSPAYDEHVDRSKESSHHGRRRKVIRMKGDAMIDAYIPDNALLIVESCNQPHSNNIVLACVNGEFIVRRYVENSSGARLMPANPKYEPIPLSHGTKFSIIDKVIRVLIDIEQ